MTMCDAGLVGQTTDVEGARQKSTDYTQEKVSKAMLKKLGLVTLLTTRRERSAGQNVNRVRTSMQAECKMGSRVGLQHFFVSLD